MPGENLEAALMFTKILIANRGEIACRIIKTCRRLGIGTVAVYSEADANARHVRLADEAFCVGPATAAESYLRIEKLLDAAKRSSAQAIHPGYGFLSENAAFAQACAEAGIVFIGPPIAAIQAMGSKSAAKSLMEKAGVPLVPGYHGDDQAADFLTSQAGRIGYPVLIKASAGGGGRGMRVVERDTDFAAALASCQREAMASFGDDRVLIEKYLQQPRHIEIQIFGDIGGDVISLFERDCSAQRRHQKVVEEAPAPGIRDEQRAAMCRAACDAARAVSYVGAGTVEFIVDHDSAFYFMEMNTRLQVEHPVTEMVSRLDLVEWQMRIAAGESLPLKQQDIAMRGHAIEGRIYAEEPEKGFLPSIGKLARFRAPLESPNVRVDTGVDEGDMVTPHYDPMLAKLIVWDETRERATARMLQALSEFQVVGVGNNIDFLSRLISHPDFRRGRVDTGLIERERVVLLGQPSQPGAPVFAAAALWLLQQETVATRACLGECPDVFSPWGASDGWRLNGFHLRRLALRSGLENHTLSLRYAAHGITINDEPANIQSCIAGETLSFRFAGNVFKADVIRLGEQLHIFISGQHHTLTLIDPLAHTEADSEVHGGLTAPMPGKIIEVLSGPGAEVEKGTPLLVMEAMKMEHTLCAPAKGCVVEYLCKAGEQVLEGVALIDFKIV